MNRSPTRDKLAQEKGQESRSRTPQRSRSPVVNDRRSRSPKRSQERRDVVDPEQLKLREGKRQDVATDEKGNSWSSNARNEATQAK